jgi:hypothetical protein
LIFSLQPLGFNFGKQEDAHRLDRKRDDLSKDLQNEQSSTTTGTPKITPKKRKRKQLEDESESDDEDDEEDLGLPKIKGHKGISFPLQMRTKRSFGTRFRSQISNLLV